MGDSTLTVIGAGAGPKHRWDELTADQQAAWAALVRVLLSDLFRGRGNRSMRRALGAHAHDRDRIVTALRRLHPELPADANAAHRATVTPDPHVMAFIVDDGIPIDDGPIGDQVLALLWDLGPDLDLELWPALAVEDFERIVARWVPLLEFIVLGDDIAAGHVPPPPAPASPRVLASQLVTAPGAPPRLASA